MLIEEAELSTMVSHYRRLSVRNLAVNKEGIFKTAGSTYIPFFASVYWKGAAMMEGTLHTEGFLVIPEENEGDTTSVWNAEKTTDIRSAIKKLIQLSGWSDSATEQNIEALRGLETAARTVHFTAIGTGGKSVDEATAAFLQDTVGVLVFGDVLYVPMIKALVQGFGDALTGMIEGLADGLSRK